MNLDRRRLDGYLEEVADAEDDMLEITYDQLPKGYMNREFDWSGQTNYAGMHRKASRPHEQIISNMHWCLLVEKFRKRRGHGDSCLSVGL